MNFGFNTAVKGLLASQRSIYIANHNIGNVNTKGYSRQEGFQRATTAFELPGIGYLGTGTEIYDIQRVRDSYIDFKYWNERAPQGEWAAKRGGLYEIEKLFGEPSNSSFRQYMDDFYKALETMSTNPSDPAYREPVRENALALTKHINSTAVRLEQLRKETEVSIETRVKNINSMANQIASLNRQIYSDEVDGRAANDLRDRRDLLVDELSQIANVRVNESEDGKYRVSISGVSIVDHIHVSEIKLEKDENDPTKEIKAQWSNGSEVKLRSGELKGLLELYNEDGENNKYRGIPYYQKRLDEFAKGFADKFNEQHEKGWGLNGKKVDKFFDYDDTKGIAATITLSHGILEDLEYIAAAGDENGSADDNGNLLELINQRENRNFFGSKDEDEDKKVSQGTPDDFIKSILSNLAVDSMQSQRMYSSQNIMLDNIQSKRDSISGVSYDEEMGDIVRFQHAYIASAKMVSTLDTIMDVTINRLGLVGR